MRPSLYQGIFHSSTTYTYNTLSSGHIICESVDQKVQKEVVKGNTAMVPTTSVINSFRLADIIAGSHLTVSSN